jgi:hypothetical protein
MNQPVHFIRKIKERSRFPDETAVKIGNTVMAPIDNVICKVMVTQIIGVYYIDGLVAVDCMGIKVHNSEEK